MEYVIWGIPAGATEETLLLARVQGEPITTRADAEKFMRVLERKFKPSKMRIQEIDLSKPLDWKKEIGI